MKSQKRITIITAIALLVMLALNNITYATSSNYTEEDYKTLLQDYMILKIKNEALNDDKAKLEQRIKEMERYADFLGRIVRQGEANQVPVLLYHHILPKDDLEGYRWNNNDSVVSLESFQAQMKYLKDNNYYTATLKDLERFIKGEQKLPKKTVVITFDDGYLSNLVHAYPVMKEYGFKGTIFVIGDSEKREKEEYDPATTQRIYLPEAEEYSDVFEYGCHTYDFHFIENGQTMLEVLDKESIKEDLEKSKKLLNATAIAYPFGKYNETTIEAVQELGYTLGFTVKSDYVVPKMSLYEIPRFIIGPSTPMEEFINIVSKHPSSQIRF